MMILNDLNNVMFWKIINGHFWLKWFLKEAVLQALWPQMATAYLSQEVIWFIVKKPSSYGALKNPNKNFRGLRKFWLFWYHECITHWRNKFRFFRENLNLATIGFWCLKMPDVTDKKKRAERFVGMLRKYLPFLQQKQAADSNF